MPRRAAVAENPNVFTRTAALHGDNFGGGFGRNARETAGHDFVAVTVSGGIESQADHTRFELLLLRRPRRRLGEPHPFLSDEGVRRGAHTFSQCFLAGAIESVAESW